jgi:hypothetical protein
MLLNVILNNIFVVLLVERLELKQHKTNNYKNVQE